MKLIVTGSYEESSRIAADMFEEVIINKKNPLLGCATGSTPIGLYQCLTEDYRAGKSTFQAFVPSISTNTQVLQRAIVRVLGILWSSIFFLKLILKRKILC